ncbi:MAG: phosphoenolpyruvate synthase [Tannerella sp.]|nr:phosphoenolpyruvate synthase [Tannerella sp.]
MNEIRDFRKVAFKDTSFADLMNRRIYNVLLIATRYDAFMLEEDGRVDEQIFNEYMALSLRYPPRFTQVTNGREALREMEGRRFELVIFMPNMIDRDIFGAAKEIKQCHPSIPIVVLTPFSKEVSKRVASEDLSAIDCIFSWLGNTDLLLAIIKLIEDRMNAPKDTASVGVQVILLVEDSIRFYSSALPLLYKFVLEQSREFAGEALNAHLKTLRMRGRPKIMLARTYDEAVQLFDRYRDNMLGIISDMSFMRNGVKDPLAGLRFGQHVRRHEPPIPLVLQSSESGNFRYAEELDASFIDKYSKNYPQDLQKEVRERFGFGDFVILNPETREEIMRIKDLKDLQNKLCLIPDDSLAYHLSRNHFSRFFHSRALFPPAALLKGIDAGQYQSMDEARQFIFDVIVQYRRMKNSGTVAVYQRDRFDEYSNFARIGEGSLGGKGRGLAFVGTMLKRYPRLERENFPVTIPRTVVLCTDIFDEFMENNRLYPVALSELPDDAILHHFLNAALPEHLADDLAAFVDSMKRPVAVRSSSLLEDAHYQPFAGVYSTYMLARLPDRQAMQQAVSNAVKGVYASVFFRDSRAYMRATSNLIDREKMAVVLQEMVGTAHGDRFYPLISGVARSLNYYPTGPERTEDGIAQIALGLGKYIVDGGTALRFSPAHPRHILQLGTPRMALRETQTRFFALDLRNTAAPIQVDNTFNLQKLTLDDADKDGVLQWIASTYDPVDRLVRDGYWPQGRKILSFAHCLEHDLFPLAPTLAELLDIGQRETGRPVEIEFAVDMPPGQPESASFHFLQIRPAADRSEVIDQDLSQIPRSETILFSTRALGHGVLKDVRDIIYIRTDRFDPAGNPAIAREIEQLNHPFALRGESYILIGPGRWGSEDPWLGIPVKWAHISQACVIAEYSPENYRVDPSQGTHFFHNLTSFGVAYYTIHPSFGEGHFDEDFLNRQPAVCEAGPVRHVRFDRPLVVKTDGLRSLGVVMRSRE